MTWRPYKLQTTCCSPPDLPLIVSDLSDIKHCTRQQELYHRICMEIQDVDAPPLRYGTREYHGAVRADRHGGRICYAYLKHGETLTKRHSQSRHWRARTKLYVTSNVVWIPVPGQDGFPNNELEAYVHLLWKRISHQTIWTTNTHTELFPALSRGLKYCVVHSCPQFGTHDHDGGLD